MRYKEVNDFGNMVASTYIKDSTKRLQSKYQEVKNHLESRYVFIQGRFISKVHRENSDIEKLRGSFNSLIAQTSAAYFNNSDSKETIDWTRGRFKGDTLHIVVQNSQIVEKVFLTRQRNIIIVKRKDLGLLARLSINN